MLTSLNVVLRPASRGFVELASADPVAGPRIQYNLLAEREDVERLRMSIEWTRSLMRESALSDFIGEESFPGAAAEGDAVDAYVRKVVGTAHHPGGTCAIGSVVDPELRVVGIDGLRVADASVMPELVGGHTNAVAIMIGEKAADMIKARRG
nr:GMC oxidoreductase [Sphingomonas chungangi]